MWALIGRCPETGLSVWAGHRGLSLRMHIVRKDHCILCYSGLGYYWCNKYDFFMIESEDTEVILNEYNRYLASVKKLDWRQEGF